MRLELELTALRAHALRQESRAESAASQRDYYSNLFDNSPVGDLILNARGTILEANRQSATILGHGHLIDAPFSAFVVPEDLTEFLEHLRRCANTSGVVSTELSITRPRGQKRPIELISAPMSSGGSQRVEHFRTLIVDITQRKSARNALELTQQNYRALIDSIEGVVWEADPHTLDIIFVSQFAERLLGYSTEIWRQPGFWARHIHVIDRDRVLAEVTKLVGAGQGSYTVDYRMLDSERRVLWVRDTITIFTHGARTRLLGVAINITDRKELEARLNEAQFELERRVTERTSELSSTISDLEAFSYSMSHDLRAPLRAMEGYAQILQERLKKKLQPLENDFFNRISASAQRLDGLIQDVLKYSRVARSPLELGLVNVGELMQSIIKDYPSFQPPRAHIEVSEPLLRVQGNEAFLTQCISNLLSNAVKFVKPGDSPRIRVWTEELSRAVRLCFEDNGIGIAPENQTRIFGIFQRMHSPKDYEGTGIGLAIVKKAAERMGGRVGVESTPGQGSRFWLELPAPRA